MQFQLPAKKYQKFEQDRRKALNISDELRIESKAAIGFLLKEKRNDARKSLAKAEKMYAELRKLLSDNAFLYSVGGVGVGTEEYVEAQLLSDYLSSDALSTLDELKVHHEAYICGLCDMSGELLRYARRYPDKMKKVYQDLGELHQACLQVIITRNNVVRKKLEDLERNVLKLEEMMFQYALKNS